MPCSAQISSKLLLDGGLDNRLELIWVGEGPAPLHEVRRTGRPGQQALDGARGTSTRRWEVPPAPFC